jgi:hypothetical protein
MTPADFYNQYNGKAINDDSYAGVQCVDAFRVFCKWIGSSAYPTPNGWADGYWYGRSAHADLFDSVPVGQFRNGDWVIWAKWSKSHESSHIAMYYNGYEFGQNQSTSRVFTLKSTNFSDALGALRWRGFENMSIELKEGLQDITYNGVLYKVVKAESGYGLRLISAGDSMTVKDITQIDSDKLDVRAKVNASYFDMSNTSANGTHYGVEQSETLDDCPKNSGYLVFAEKNDGTIVEGDASDYWLTKKDVVFGVTPYACRIHNGTLVYDRSTAYGDKDDTKNSQTAVFKIADGRWCLAVTATGQTCCPRDITAMAQACGATECIIMDSGGSTQMFAYLNKVVYTGRKIANVLALAKDITSTDSSTSGTTGDTTSTDDKDAQIKSLQSQVTTLTSELKTANDKLTQIKALC